MNCGPTSASGETGLVAERKTDQRTARSQKVE
jgi:hypothetical protein